MTRQFLNSDNGSKTYLVARHIMLRSPNIIFHSIEKIEISAEYIGEHEYRFIVLLTECASEFQCTERDCQ